ncbi:hypothetical protein J4U00_gp133 [Mycobacterium phage DyoEdafos]|uniref:Uncharacterized protein n=1 Tax=Mycobacterium phage DyoEdafos TaxID=2599860 RepID=A0A5J6TIX7_9CAUD|nr:hypothetical protein J4U00_gp133 [Mycobacterium phage DyoEdafos]QFG10348.1 hypothetical protein SEA_DYOEDAFOS_136 [Mycobacterium phage DyoEdafos]
MAPLYDRLNSVALSLHFGCDEESTAAKSQQDIAEMAYDVIRDLWGYDVSDEHAFIKAILDTFDMYGYPDLESLKGISEMSALDMADYILQLLPTDALTPKRSDTLCAAPL